MTQKTIIERAWAMPSKNTFTIPPIRNLIETETVNRLGQVWIDPFQNENKIADITNDLNPNFDTDYHLDQLDFLRKFKSKSIDGILFDPPYSPRQVSECYNGIGHNVTQHDTSQSFWADLKKEIGRIAKPNGKVISFGWNSNGIGKINGFEIVRILIVQHGGWHNDTICTVEIKR